MRLAPEEWQNLGTLLLALPRLKTDKAKAEVKNKIKTLENKVTKAPIMNVKEILITTAIATLFAVPSVILTSCGETETPPAETCAGIYDNGQPCDQEYDPNYQPPAEPIEDCVGEYNNEHPCSPNYEQQ
jgi:hypothetical protein